MLAGPSKHRVPVIINAAHTQHLCTAFTLIKTEGNFHSYGLNHSFEKIGKPVDVLWIIKTNILKPKFEFKFTSDCRGKRVVGCTQINCTIICVFIGLVMLQI